MSLSDQLSQLTALHRAGAMTNEEFAAAKRKVLEQAGTSIDESERHNQAGSEPTANAPVVAAEQLRPRTSDPSHRTTPWRRALWKTYFAYCLLQFVVIIYIAMASSGVAPDPLGLVQTQQSSAMQTLEAISTLFIGVGLVGLYGFVFGVHVGRQSFWSWFYKSFIVIDVIAIVVNINDYHTELATVLGGLAGPVAVIAGLVTVLTVAPKYYALYRYSNLASWRPLGH